MAVLLAFFLKTDFSDMGSFNWFEFVVLLLLLIALLWPYFPYRRP